MTTTNDTRLIFTSIEHPIRAYEPWPIADNSLEVVDIGECVAHLPRGEPRMGLEDGWVTFMQEAWRCMEPGGLLTVVAPMASHGMAVADPRNVRYFNEASFLFFGGPKDNDEHKCTRWGTDYGCRFDIIRCVDQSTTWVCVMEKPE